MGNEGKAWTERSGGGNEALDEEGTFLFTRLLLIQQRGKIRTKLRTGESKSNTGCGMAMTIYPQ